MYFCSRQLEDSCIDRHRDERKCLAADDSSEVTSVQDTEDEQEIIVSDDGDGDYNLLMPLLERIIKDL